MAAPCRLLGDGITDDTLLNIAGFLPTARDLLCLKLTHRRFAAKVIAAPASGAGSAAAAPRRCCASRMRRGGCWWRGWVPRREPESRLCLMHEVGLPRQPLLFGRAHASILLSEGGAVATKGATEFYWRTAANKVAMRSGRHFAQFTVGSGNNNMFFGLIRPGWDVEGGVDAYTVDGHCFYSTAYGEPLPRQQRMGGKQPAEQGDRIGMLLDLDQDSMTVWKNDEKLGVMVAEGPALLGGVSESRRQCPHRVGPCPGVADR